MTHTADFLAVDLGASSGRLMVGHWDGAHVALTEVHRFANAPVRLLGAVHWNVLQLWQEVQVGLRRYAVEYGKHPASIGVDTWGLDYALLDARDRLLGIPYTYRDGRTNGMVEQVTARVPHARIFATTGIQFMQINTLYQLYSMAQTKDPQLAVARTLLMIPDLFHFWLGGGKAIEYTNATTTQFLHCTERRWATELLAALDIPTHFLPPLVAPGTEVGSMRAEIQAEVGFVGRVPVVAPATHDTASAVAAVPLLNPRSAYISSGTWSLMGMELSHPVLTTDAQAYNVTNEGGVNGTYRLLKNITGLWLLQESRRQWQREGLDYSWEQLLKLTEQAQPFRSLIDPDDGAFLLPGDLPCAIRDYCRRTNQPAPDSIGAVVRCCLEGLALRYRWTLHALETLTGVAVETIRIVGGGSQNRLLCQWTADACGRPVVAGPVEATAFGNVLMQAVAGGYLPDIAAARQALADSVTLETYEPGGQAGWDEAYVRFVDLLDSTLRPGRA